jgi:signal transduction histidine kinase
MIEVRDKKYNYFFLKVAFMVALYCIFISELFSAEQNNTTRKVVITEINLNGISIPIQLYNSIVISTEDSLVINYSCEVSRKEETPFRFVITLRNSNGDANTKPYNDSTTHYKGLSEGNYQIIIGAHSSEWKADSIVLKFVVNNKTARVFLAKVSEYAEKHKEKPAPEVIKDTAKNQEESKSFVHIEISSIVIGIIIGVLSISIIILIIALGNKRKTKKSKYNKIKGKSNMGNGQSKPLNSDEIDKIILENSNLRAEIAALRGQIDAMQTRAEDLKNQNNILKEQVDRLSTSQSEILDLQQQKDDLFAVIIHDIKNPAALIKSLVDLLRSYDLTATEQQEVIEDIMESTKRIVNLSQEVTRILSLEGTTLQLSLHPTDINEIASVVHRRNRIAAESKNIEMSLDIKKNIPDSLMDAAKIDEVLDNLTSNAIKFSHKGGKVKLQTKYENNIIYVEVSDNGLGLSKEDIQRAFQKGSKLSARPTGAESSSGFGLWIVKKLIEAHGGNVEVKSTLGVGSTFTVELPYINIDRKDTKRIIKDVN